MEYVPPINGNLADPDRPYINANPGASVEGSIPPAESIEHPMREIIHVIEEAGLTPDGGDLEQLYQAIQALIAAAVPTATYSGIEGLTVANNSGDANNDIDAAAGSALSDDKTTIIALSSALTKRLDATFTAGNNQGGLDTGSKANSTTYHIFAIKNPTTSAVDVLFSTSVSSPTMPSGFTKKRRIGSMRTNGSGNIIGFYQMGNHFLFKSPTIDINATQGTTANLYSLPVPAGLKVEAIVSATVQNGNNNFINITDPDLNITGVPDINTPPFITFGDGLSTTGPGGTYRCFTNTSSQVRINAAAASSALKGSVVGYLDERRI